MSSKSKNVDVKRKDEVHDLEQQFILRLPPGQAMALEHELDNGGNLKENLFIDINPDSRWGSVQYGGEVINAKLVDMPCVIETLKSTDSKTFYKTADISQMLICSNDMEPSDDESESPKKKKEKEKKYHYPHGITPPLKNVRRRRFRKTLRKKPIDLASIEKEVKRLLRTDLEAIEVKYEEVADDTPASSGKGGRGGQGDAANVGDQLDEEKLFGEISSSDGELDVNVDDDSDTEQMRITPITQPTSVVQSELDNLGDDFDMDDDDDALIQKITKLKSELSAVEERIASQEAESKTSTDKTSQRRYEAILDELIAERDDLIRGIRRLENS